MTARKLKVHLVGGDSQGWALDVDLRMTQQALDGVVEFVDSPSAADVIHSVNAELLVSDPRVRSKLTGDKLIISHFTSLPSALFEEFPTLYSECKKWVCVAQTRQAADQLQLFGIPQIKSIPYVAELESFFPIPATDAALIRLRKELEIPDGRYVIGSFVRDSLGADLNRFKPQKGADIFLAVVLGAAKRVGFDKIHVLLAGPRRHWLRGQLRKHGISFSFAGKITEGDDFPENILDLETLNRVSNLIDLYLIPSRWEGAPAGLFHNIACKNRVISTDIAAPRDVLPKDALFHDVSGGIELVVRDIETGYLEKNIESNHRKVFENHSPAAVRKYWKEIYDELANGKLVQRAPSDHGQTTKATQVAQDALYSLRYRLLWKPLLLLNRVRKKVSSAKAITVWGEIVDGPYGGGSQILKAVMEELKRRGFLVFNNSLNDSDGHIMNSTFFDTERATSVVRASTKNPRVIHRIDGPISLYRGKDRHLDEAIFKLNREIVTSTAFQCIHSWIELKNMGLEGRAPMIIRNASDAGFFFPREEGIAPGRKIRLISTAWSNNAMKGFDTYKYLDENLDFSRFEYRFVGRSPIAFKNIQMFDAVPSKGVGEHLRWADLFITASKNDPASNSLVEALTCGLPAIYLKSGGHPEIASYAGLCYDSASEIPGKIDLILKDFESYRICTHNKSISEVTDQYLKALNLV